jgi:hypothetical protein
VAYSSCRQLQISHTWCKCFFPMKTGRPFLVQRVDRRRFLLLISLLIQFAIGLWRFPRVRCRARHHFRTCRCL